MNGQSPAARGNLETRLGSRLRDLGDRIRTLENRRKVSIGMWRLEEGPTGDLIAVHATDGIQVVIASTIRGGV